MTPGPLLAAFAVAAAPVAQEAPVVPAAPAPQGVIAYPAAFFAEAQPNTAFDMIDRLPGFSFDSGDEVRGFGGAAGNVLIDGERPTSKSDNLESILRRVPAAQVERIDLIRGGAPGVDMMGKTVLANVVRKKGASTTGLVSATTQRAYDGRNIPGLRLEAARRGNGRALEGSFVINGYVDDGAGDGPRTKVDGTGAVLARRYVHSEGDGVQATATGAYERPLAGGKLRVNGMLMNDRWFYDEALTPLAGAAVAAVERDREDEWNSELGATYNRDLGPRTRIEALVLNQFEDETSTARYAELGQTNLFANDRTNGETVSRVTLRYAASPQLALEAGGEGAFNWLESQTDYSENGAPVALPAANVRVEERRGELFGTATWKPTATLTLETGLRWEASRIQSKGDTSLEKSLSFAKPRAVVTWSPNPATQLRLKVERQVGQLDFDDFVASSSLTSGVITAGNPDLDPEQAWVVEGAFERRFWSKGAVVLTLRHSELTDAIDRAPVFAGTDIFDAPGNIGDGTKDLATLALTLPLDHLGLRGGLLRGEHSWKRSAVTDPTTGQRRRISGEQPSTWETHFSQDLPAWRANWGVDAYGGWRRTYYRFNEVETRKLKTFVVPFFEYKPRRDLGVRLEVRNATERGFENIRVRYAGPRNLNPAVASTDTQDLQIGRFYWVRVRKTFG